jgi:nicotinamidase-related amidase
MALRRRDLISVAKLKSEFLRLLTEDSPHHDARRKDFNQAIFDAKEGYAVFTNTDLEMVMEKFNKAVSNLITTGQGQE